MVYGPHLVPVDATRSALESATKEGDSPVVEATMVLGISGIGHPGYDVRRWEALTSNPKYLRRPIAYKYREGKLKRTRDRE